MRPTRGRTIAISTVEELDRRIAAGASTMRGWRLEELDLTERSQTLRAVSVTGASFVGCTLSDSEEQELPLRGAVVLPRPPADLPLEVDRRALYAPAELYDAPAYAATTDARAYAWATARHDRGARLARALHDHAIDEALSQWIVDRRLVGVMGGHSVARGDAAYADAARLGSLLGERHVVATGGGPGAMEAANLGARFAGRSDAELLSAVDRLARVPSFRPSIDAWVGSAAEVLGSLESDPDHQSLGIPTWHYGHEPPNLFATAIAKYFGNAVREAVLLQVCDAGIVFLPGAAGTVQEIFQDACENYYADRTAIAPMVLVGHDHWTRELPVWPLLRALAAERAMADHVHLVDTVEEAAQLISG